MFPMNLGFLCDNDNNDPQKNRFPLCIGYEALVVSRLVQNLLSRLSTWDQLGIGERDALLLAVVDILDMHKHGYDFRQIRRAIHTCKEYSFFLVLTYKPCGYALLLLPGVFCHGG